MAKGRALAAIALLGMVCVGCGASGPAFKPVVIGESEAAIYIYRPGSGYVGSGVMLSIECDKRKIGTLKTNGYVVAVVPPGRHAISCATETKSEVPFQAESGKSYYIEAEVQMGLFIGRPKLTMVPREQGELAILGTKYSGNKPYETHK